MDALSSSYRSAVVYVGSALILVALTTLLPSAVVVLSVLLISLGGVPHGAVDLHLTLPGAQRWRELAVYLVSMSAVLLGWYLSSPVMLAFFLVNSAWHFGDCDLSTPHAAKPVLALVYGLAVLLVVINPLDPSIYWILEDLIGQADLSSFVTIIEPYLVPMRIIAMVLVVTVPVSTNHTTRIAALVRGILIVGMGLMAPSLVAFTWYFVVIHSWTSLSRLRFYVSATEPWTWRRLIVAAAPLSVVTYAGVVIGYLLLPISSLTALLFVALSALTLPHSRLFSRVYATR